MKRSQALRKLTRVLKTWEGSMIESRTAKQALDFLEKEIGMKPPDNKWTPEYVKIKKRTVR